MLFQRDFDSGQFKHLSTLYAEAVVALEGLQKKYPAYAGIWATVSQKMDIIKNTIDHDEIPSDDLKRQADMTSMLNYELRDFADEKLSAIYKLDSAYTLLGMKNIDFDMNHKMK